MEGIMEGYGPMILELNTLSRDTLTILDHPQELTSEKDFKQRISFLEHKLKDVCKSSYDLTKKLLELNEPTEKVSHHKSKSKSLYRVSSEKKSRRLSCNYDQSPITNEKEKEKDSDKKNDKLTHRVRHRSKSGTVPSSNLPGRQQKTTQHQLTESSPISLVVHPPTQTVGTLTPNNSSNSYHTVGRKVQKFYAINDYDEFVLAVDKKRVRGYSVGRQDDQELLPLELFFNESSTLSEPLPPVVCNVDALEHGFKVENECELFNPKTYKLDIQREVYKEQYSDSKHLIWVGSFPKSEEYFIVTLLDMPTQRENLYQALEHSKKGIQEFEIVCIKKKESKNSKIFEKALEQHFLSASFYPLKTTPEIIHDMINIEAKHKLVVTRLEIAIIYAKAGQKNPLDMFHNEGSPEYEKFQKILTSRQKWHGLEVIWHVATQMNEEQHRRCIGNCQCILFFKESHKLFSVDQISNLGVIPQFFVVVEPFQDRYRLGFFQRTILHPFGPQLPANHIFDVLSLVDFLFTKVHNGYMAAMRCPGPISRLHEQPLSFAIKEVVEKYCPKTWLNKQKH